MKLRSRRGDAQYQAALTEMQRKKPNVAAATKLLRRALEQDNPRAAYALGTWYLHGVHVGHDARRAVGLLKKAAQDDQPDALYDLAVCYEQGEGTARNLKRAFESYLRAALVGEKQSVYEVGRCYFYGIGTTRDRHVAKVWLDRAKALGVVE